MRRVSRRNRSWDILTFLEDLTLLIWSLITIELDFDFSLLRSWPIYSYYLISSGCGVDGLLDEVVLASGKMETWMG